MEFVVKCLHRYLSAKSLRDLLTILFDSLATNHFINSLPSKSVPALRVVFCCSDVTSLVLINPLFDGLFAIDHGNWEKFW